MASGLTIFTPPHIGDSSPSFQREDVQTTSSSYKNSPRSSAGINAPTITVTSSSVASTKLSSTAVTKADNKNELTINKSRTNEEKTLYERNNAIKRKHYNFNSDKYYYKRRRRNDSLIVLPTKFLLGGNIKDPLNLEGISKDEQITPQSSPMPTPTYKKEVEVLIPANINDPLNLNCDEEESDVNLLPANKMKNNRKKRKNRRRLDSEASIEQDDDLKLQSQGNVNTNINANNNSNNTNQTISPMKTLSLNLNQTNNSLPSKALVANIVGINNINNCNSNNVNDQKIVSPVIPQPKPPSSRNRKPVPEMSKRKEKFQQHNYRTKDEKFIHGNYNRYYGYRNRNHDTDKRVSVFKKEWFENKFCLDIGCNTGHVTLEIAKKFNPKKIIGVDIDESLIRIARKNIRHYLNICSNGEEFPISMRLCYGPILPSTVNYSIQALSSSSSSSLLPSSTSNISLPSTSSSSSSSTIASSLNSSGSLNFPNNVNFLCGDYMNESNDQQLLKEEIKYDLILCLSVTKWIHLNWSDDGLKRFFKKIFSQLKPGGKFILEPQSWCSYTRKKHLTEKIFKNYISIKFRPEKFNDYLLSSEVGFNRCELIATPEHSSKGFRRPIFMFTKSESARSEAKD